MPSRGALWDRTRRAFVFPKVPHFRVPEPLPPGPPAGYYAGGENGHLLTPPSDQRDPRWRLNLVLRDVPRLTGVENEKRGQSRDAMAGMSHSRGCG